MLSMFSTFWVFCYSKEGKMLQKSTFWLFKGAENIFEIQHNNVGILRSLEDLFKSTIWIFQRSEKIH